MTTPNSPLTRDFLERIAKLHRFADIVEEAFVDRVNQLDRDLDSRAAAMRESDRVELYEAYTEDYYELGDELPTALRNAVLTAADSALEAYLNSTCSAYSSLNELTVELGDFRGSGVERARQFLKKVARVPFPDGAPSWTTVSRLHRLRNSVVHAEGYVVEGDPTFDRWLGEFSGVRLATHRVVTFGPAFTRAALSAYECFASDFDEACADLQLWRTIFDFDDPPSQPDVHREADA